MGMIRLSLLVAMFSEGRLPVILNCAQLSHSPTHWHAETCSGPSEGLPIFPTFLKGSGQGCPLLRASNEHILMG
jgi:hypothetical protein